MKSLFVFALFLSAWVTIVKGHGKGKGSTKSKSKSAGKGKGKGTSSPTPQPTPKPTTAPKSCSICIDDPDFRWRGESEKTCKWVRNDQTRRESMCSLETSVRIACPLACGECCADDANFTFDNDHGEKWNCAIIAKNQSRLDKWCPEYVIDTTADEGSNVRAKCPQACDFCFDRMRPRNCVDDAEFTFLNDHGKDWNCAMIAKEQFRADKWCCENVWDTTAGEKAIVRTKCPETCNSCIEPPKRICQDDSSFTFLNDHGKEWNCELIAMENLRVDKWCPEHVYDTTAGENTIVRNKCSYTCDDCTNEPTVAPTVTLTELPSITPSIIPTAIPSTIPTTPPTSDPTSEPSSSPPLCQDDPSFAFLNDHGKEWNCAIIATQQFRAAKWCPKHVYDTTAGENTIVKNRCSHTCDLCTNEPTIVPTVTPTVGPTIAPFSKTCFDDSLFTFLNDHGKEWNCAIIAKEQLRADKWCPKHVYDTTAGGNTIVQTNCQATCDVCTTEPTITPTLSPTPCQDDPSFTFLNDHGKEWSCAIIAQEQIRVDKWCDENVYDTTASENSIVETKCPATCNACTP